MQNEDFVVDASFQFFCFVLFFASFATTKTIFFGEMFKDATHLSLSAF